MPNLTLCDACRRPAVMRCVSCGVGVCLDHHHQLVDHLCADCQLTWSQQDAGLGRRVVGGTLVLTGVVVAALALLGFAAAPAFFFAAGSAMPIGFAAGVVGRRRARRRCTTFDPLVAGATITISPRDPCTEEVTELVRGGWSHRDRGELPRSGMPTFWR